MKVFVTAEFTIRYLHSFVYIDVPLFACVRVQICESVPTRTIPNSFYCINQTVGSCAHRINATYMILIETTQDRDRSRDRPTDQPISRGGRDRHSCECSRARPRRSPARAWSDTAAPTRRHHHRCRRHHQPLPPSPLHRAPTDCR